MIAAPENSEFAATPARRRWLRGAKLLLQATILALICWGMWGTIDQALTQLRQEGVSIWKVHYGWLALAGALYIVGMLPCSLFWNRVMTALQQHVPTGDAVTAYFVSQLGRYVPGKIMVLILRYAWVSQHGVSRTLTIASIFIETLTMMSVGAVIGGVMFALSVSNDWRVLGVTVLVSICVGAPTLPPVFLRVVKWTRLQRLDPKLQQSLAGLNWHILWPGWIAIAAGWIAMGLSLWAVLRALPELDVSAHIPDDLPILVACVALASVAGFVSGLPGGIGAREWVVIKLVEPQFGASAAVLSAILQRIVILLAECVFAGTLVLLSRWRRRQARAAHDGDAGR